MKKITSILTYVVATLLVVNSILLLLGTVVWHDIMRFSNAMIILFILGMTWLFLREWFEKQDRRWWDTAWIVAWLVMGLVALVFVVFMVISGINL